MKAKCPNCGEAIDLVGAGELQNEYGIGPNALQHARDQGNFPEPWLSFGNRNIYLRVEVEDYREHRARQKVERTVTDLLDSISALPEAEAATAIGLLEEKLGVSTGSDSARGRRSKSRN